MKPDGSTDDDATDERYHVRHDWESNGPLSRTVVDAIAAVREAEPGDVEPLGTVVDPDAMDRLFEPSRASSRRDGAGHIGFEFDGYDVRVTSSGDVSIRRNDDHDADEIATEAAFEAELARLVREAEANGVAVDGGWACKDDSERPE